MRTTHTLQMVPVVLSPPRSRSSSDAAVAYPMRGGSTMAGEAAAAAVRAAADANAGDAGDCDAAIVNCISRAAGVGAGAIAAAGA